MNKVLSLVIMAIIVLTGCHTECKKEVDTLKKELAMNKQTAERNKANTRAFLKALEDMNVDAVVDLFDEEGVHINPYSSGLFSEGTSGKDGIRQYWAPVFPNFEKMEFPIEEIYAMEDPTMTFVKFEGRIKLKNDAGWYNNDYYATFKFNEEGKITEYVEIFNPITAARGFGLIDKIK
ncbi:nuclear transport factor 2 family protein [Carboxylicivirga sp. RSCT41]|uniref:nuclear transport factor 2 family protein n=1 Tax=Carboxylicivirga agarovorans TaxID=3417570 RepID=UPI003D356D86